MTHPPDKLSLVADIGGTNTRRALADGRALLCDPAEPDAIASARNTRRIMPRLPRP